MPAAVEFLTRFTYLFVRAGNQGLGGSRGIGDGLGLQRLAPNRHADDFHQLARHIAPEVVEGGIASLEDEIGHR